MVKVFLYFSGNYLFCEDDDVQDGTFLPVSVNCSEVDNTKPISFMLPGIQLHRVYHVRKMSKGRYQVVRDGIAYQDFG